MAGERKHTAGPWFVHWQPVGDEGDGVTDMGRLTGYEPSGDIQDANGRVVPLTAENEQLKASAPHLLEALEGLVAAEDWFVRDTGGHDLQDPISEAVEAARAAIAAATAQPTGGEG